MIEFDSNLSKNVKEMLLKAEELGWTITDNGYFIFEFSKTSSIGHDFCFWIDTENDMDVLVGSLNEIYDNFDLSHEINCFMDKHKNSDFCSYDKETIYNDLKACLEDVKKLCSALNGIVIQKEKTDRKEFYRSLNDRIKLIDEEKKKKRGVDSNVNYPSPKGNGLVKA